MVGQVRPCYFRIVHFVSGYALLGQVRSGDGKESQVRSIYLTLGHVRLLGNMLLHVRKR
jgi:hypothetical protein